jgi:selenide,water dikinase
VTGTIDPSRVIRNSGAEVGDVLFLTKPLGTGIISTAIKRGSCPADLEARAIAVMTELNREASVAMVEAGAHAGTDITGYGLLGHLREMLLASGVGARLNLAAIPVMDGVRQLCEQGFYPGGSVRNLDSIRPFVEGAVDEADLRVMADAQTSGGLLMSVSPGQAKKLGYPHIGEIVGRPGAIVFG